MSIFDAGLISMVQVFWVVAIYFLIRLAIRRIKPQMKAIDWQYQTQFSRIRPRSNMITLMKIFYKIRSSNPLQLSVLVRDEMISNTAMLYGKPNAYFVKYRNDDKIMHQYFQNEELLSFIRNPKYWCRFNGGVTRRFFGLIQDETNASSAYYGNLERILATFQKEIARGRRPQTQQGEI